MYTSRLVLLLLCLLPCWVTKQHILVSASFDDLQCNNSTECVENSSCSSADQGFCQCWPGFNYATNHNNEQQCVMCPGLHDPCETDCCYPPNLTRCVNKVCQCNTNFYASTCGDMDQFRLATQIALGSAMILAIACLLIVLWKSCSRRRDISRRQAAMNGGRRTSSSASLSSTQRVVVERLRHRPPGYYDRGHIRIEKPPTYEETIEQPLRFPILSLDTGSSTQDPQHIPDQQPPIELIEIRSETHLEQQDSVEDSRHYQPDRNSGFDNIAFVNTEEKEDVCNVCETVSVSPASELHM